MICTAVGNHYQSPCRFKLSEGECKLSLLHGFVHIYHIHRLLLTKKTIVFKRLGPVDKRLTLDDVKPLIVEQIKTGLISQARFMDDSYRELGHAGKATLESSLGTDTMLNIEVHEGSPNFQGVKSGAKVRGLFVNQVVFTMAVALSGPWYCGGLRSRGSGFIFPR
ncbi:hypothetical protein D5039_21645 [Verminephrobacter aporrectodeae subsp. tuberculatae]|uniref:Uncharacterized protein n=2 Tax=Verminephrobacter TaxID=364316 RepID=A0ABT3KZB2_9BURK|nr:hypothetical protein [Verminephrobacter aporrectodeae subsp. tuberculatae]